MEQILLDIPEGLERRVAILILDLIEPSGWIKLDIDEFISKNNLEKNSTFKCFAKITKIRTNWCFSRNLGECLRLQLKEKVY